eukprot:scaffold81923_cov69-Phaeocystis_antarctica.AAC.2
MAHGHLPCTCSACVVCQVPRVTCHVPCTRRRGMYIARQLSFASAEYQTDIIDLSASQRAMYALPSP